MVAWCWCMTDKASMWSGEGRQEARHLCFCFWRIIWEAHDHDSSYLFIPTNHVLCLCLCLVNFLPLLFNYFSPTPLHFLTPSYFHFTNTKCCSCVHLFFFFLIKTTNTRKLGPCICHRDSFLYFHFCILICFFFSFFGLV